VLPEAEEIVFETDDGLLLGGWFLAAKGRSPGKKATVLVFNGNAGDRSSRAPLAEAFARGGYSVFLFDYRGYGGNPGSPTENGLRSDARAAQSYLAARPDVDPSKLLYFGESLGTALAIRLAVERPPLALVLRSPFPSLADVGRIHYPFLPIRLLLTDQHASAEAVTAIRCPVLIVAGERDRIIPAELSQRVFESLPGEKRFLLVPGADHNDEEMFTGALLLREVLGFWARTVVTGPGES
jgi:fermentation-respiration switch protein FrsA (DUF1100 family)